eukprot:364299-Chlamydomonas_euryale.AAC.15
MNAHHGGSIRASRTAAAVLGMPARVAPFAANKGRAGRDQRKLPEAAAPRLCAHACVHVGIQRTTGSDPTAVMAAYNGGALYPIITACTSVCGLCICLCMHVLGC